MMRRVITILFITLNIFNCSKPINNEYLKVKMTNNINKIGEYYYNESLKSENEICAQIKGKYSQNINEVVDYISKLRKEDESTGIKCVEDMILDDYFVNGELLEDELHKKEYSKKSENLYNKLYEKIRNPEILGYSLNEKPILDKMICEQLLEKAVKEKSWYGIRNLKFEEIRKNKNYSSFLSRYDIKQKKQVNLKNNEFTDIMLCVDTKESTLNLCISNKEKNYVEKISEYSDIETFGYHMDILDLNNDKNLEIIVEIDDNIYVYSLKNNKLGCV